MRDPYRIARILGLINTLWRNNPDWRLMQFLHNVIGSCESDHFHLEDDILEDRLNRAVREWNAQLQLEEDDYHD